MREIKFRAWHKIKKTMSEPYGIVSYHPNPIGEVCCPLETDIEIMQYTGLKDKNGKEIYEGDILQYEERDILLKVFFQNGSFMYGFGNSEAEFMHEGWNHYSKVIGDIYENPDLLK